jgi:hypothetical protein
MQTIIPWLTLIFLLTTNTRVRADLNYSRKFFWEQSFVRELLWKLKGQRELDPKCKALHSSVYALTTVTVSVHPLNRSWVGRRPISANLRDLFLQNAHKIVILSEAPHRFIA